MGRCLPERSILNSSSAESRVRCSPTAVSVRLDTTQGVHRRLQNGETTYGPKSEGVPPPGSLGGGGRLMRVGPCDLDMVGMRYGLVVAPQA